MCNITCVVQHAPQTCLLLTPRHTSLSCSLYCHLRPPCRLAPRIRRAPRTPPPTRHSLCSQVYPALFIMEDAMHPGTRSETGRPNGGGGRNGTSFHNGSAATTIGTRSFTALLGRDQILHTVNYSILHLIIVFGIYAARLGAFQIELKKQKLIKLLRSGLEFQVRRREEERE